MNPPTPTLPSTSILPGYPSSAWERRFVGEECGGHPVGPHDRCTAQEVLDLLPATPGWEQLVLGQSTHPQRLRGARRVLDWLSAQPGAGWQQRWLATGADQGAEWVDQLSAGDPRKAEVNRKELGAGLNWLFFARVLRPGYGFFSFYKTHQAFAVIPQIVSPELFTRIERTPEELSGVNLSPKQLLAARLLLIKIVLHTGKDLGQLTIEDLLEFRAAGRRLSTYGGSGVNRVWELLVRVGVLPEGSSLAAAVRRGQRPIAELVDAQGVRSAAVREVIVRYFEERRARMDYNSMIALVGVIAGTFWVDIERHHPGIDSLHLPDDVAMAWKERLRYVRGGSATGRLRKGYFQVLLGVRAFYLDIAEWAATDPSWVPHAVPSPVRKGDTAGILKVRNETVARMHQRTRERLPKLPVLLDSASQHRREQADLLAAANRVAAGEEFTVAAIRYRRVAGAKDFRGERYRSAKVRIENLETGERLNLTYAEDDAFWTWAIIETLRHTGVRLEELLEITHLALVSHRLPATGEVVPLLQIVPSKSNQERLLLVSPELANVLATIINRLRRDNDGVVPLIARYDHHERLTGPPLPHLFQRSASGRQYAVPVYTTVHRMLNDAVARAGLRDAAGDQLDYTAHDFRRIFTTEAVDSGLPLHIVARLLGHGSINVTQGYHAVFDEVLINAYRSFLNTRRELRPQAEYREPTDAEWAEFEQHFELRKLELGTCGRPYGTPCQHEHACIRCPMLRVDPRQRARLAEIAHNLTERISEARVNGWHGEIAGLQISLDAAKRKLAALEPATGPTNLGLPTLHAPPAAMAPPAQARGDARR